MGQFPGKEKMTKISILILTVLVIGTAGVTVAFAQESQPGDFLYHLRTWNQEMVQERVDAQLRDQTQTQVQADPLYIGTTTVQEMNQLQLKNQNQTRFENQNHEQNQIQNKNQIQTSSGQQIGQTGLGNGDQDRTRLQLKAEDWVRVQSRLQDRVRIHQTQP
jgi:hypothetical protein